MPVLDAQHDRRHEVEDDRAWSESYYFNGYDPVSDTGLFTRIGIRPNEGTMDVGLSVWLPDGGLAEYHAVRPPTAADEDADVLEVGDVRYAMLEPARTWDVTMRGTAPARGGTDAADGQVIDLALDLRFESLMPPIGTDGTDRTGPRSEQATAAAGTVGRGHFEQAGVWRGQLEVGGVAHAWDGALGNRDRSWGPRRWGGPRMWRWFSINVGRELHFGGIRLGTDAGDLHRGWVYDAGVATSVAEWKVRTELEDDGLTQRVVHLEVVDKRGRVYDLRGDVLRVADIGRAGGTLVNEGLTRWTCSREDGESVGYGIAEYLHQLDDDGRPRVPVE
jgi:hypothetical protein